MNTKIFIISDTSYTEGDSYMHADHKVFTDRQQAIEKFEEACNNAREECRWGNQWDVLEDERDEGCAYDVDETRQGNVQDGHAEYKADSQAYDGYHVFIKLETVDLSIPDVENNK